MAWWSRKESSNGSVAVDEAPSITLDELLERHEIVSSDSGALIVAPRQLAVMDKPDYREIGVTGSTSWGSFSHREYNTKLQGEAGIRRWDEMRRNDGMVAGALMLRKTPVLAARWYLEPASDSKRDKRVAEFIWKNLTTQMTMSWPRFLHEVMLHLDFGWYAFEKVPDKVDGKIIWRKFAPRHPLDCDDEPFEYDANGGPVGLWVQVNPVLNQNFGRNPIYPESTRRPGERLIPIRKLLVFTHAQEAGDLTGISLLRPLHKHHFIKDVLYKIDSIQKERHGIGIPVIVLPPGADTDDKRLAEQMGRNLRTNEKAHVVLPNQWELMMLKLEGQLVDPISSANHHNNMILAGVLAQFLDTNGYAGIETLVDLFMKATRSDAEVVRDTINKWAIPDLVRWNFGRNVDPPTLQVRRIGEITDQRPLSFALRNLVGANLLPIDEPLVEAVRTEFDLPQAKPETIQRLLEQQKLALEAAKQAPQAGPPRQSRAENMNQQAQGTGKSNAGRDSSGG